MIIGTTDGSQFTIQSREIMSFTPYTGILRFILSCQCEHEVTFGGIFDNCVESFLEKNTEIP